MKLKQLLFIPLVVLLLVSSAALATAGDFDWTRDFNIRAEADPSGFRAQLATRFKIGDVQIDAVLGNVKSPADAYLVLRFGEMAARPIDFVIDRYRAEKSTGWGALAQSLGIKPGSREFHALKRGADLYADKGAAKTKGKGKSKK